MTADQKRGKTSAGSAKIRQATLPVIEVCAFDGDHADELLRSWEHPLSSCDRPFGREDWLLSIDGQPAALATSASTVSATVQLKSGEWKRGQVVELARIARAPEHPFVMRVMLRLWRAYLAERWPYWTADVALSYNMPGTKGDIYRFDGWTYEGPRKKSGGSGTWTRARPAVNDVADGVKGLWSFPLGEVATLRAAA